MPSQFINALRIKNLVVVWLVFLACSAPLLADTPSYSHSLLYLYPGARAYVQEGSGEASIAITLVHDLDVSRVSLYVFARTIDGKIYGNWDHHSIPAPPGQPLLIHMPESRAAASQATYTFRDVPLAKVKMFEVGLNTQDEKEPYCLVLLDPALGVSPTEKLPRPSITAKVQDMTVHLSNGVTLTGTRGYGMSSETETGKVLDFQAEGGVVKNSDGVILLQASRIQLSGTAARFAPVPLPWYKFNRLIWIVPPCAVGLLIGVVLWVISWKPSAGHVPRAQPSV